MSAGAAERDEALERVERHADADWKRRARLALRHLAGRPEGFTADDLWELVATPVEPRALGAIIAEAMKDGLIMDTGHWVASRLPRRHRRPIRVWRGA